MTTLALNAANRSYAFLSTFIAVLDKAITMTKSVHHDTPNTDDVNRVRAIAETI